MNFERKNILSGYLVGIGKVRADGSLEYHKIPPVKNMIVKQGLNNWLRYNGNNSPIDFRNQSNVGTKYPAGNIEYCSYGTGNETNNFVTTTDLSSQCVAPYATKKINWPYCGSFVFESTKFAVRISHESPAASADTSVKEIGYYTHYTNGTNVLFSRVVLPFTYSLLAGEKLLTTYELVIQIPNSFEVGLLNSTGLYDAAGTELAAQFKNCVGIVRDYSYSSISAIDSNGSFYIGWTGSNDARMYPAFFYLNSSYNPNFNVTYSISSRNFPGNNNPDRGLSLDSNASRSIQTGTDYVVDSFQRDIIVTCPTFWPMLTNESAYADIYYMNFNAFALRFGHVVDGVFTPTPWRKYANKTARFVYRQSVATAESIAWQQSQQST